MAPVEPGARVVFDNAANLIAAAEAGVGAGLVRGLLAADALRARGHAVEQIPVLGQVSAVYCVEGLHAKRSTCTVAADERGHGLGLSAPQ